MEILKLLLLCDKRDVDTATVVKCLSLIYNKKCISICGEVFTFTESILKYSQFEKVSTEC